MGEEPAFRRRIVLIAVGAAAAAWILISQLPTVRYEIISPESESKEQGPPAAVRSVKDLQGVSENYDFTFILPEGWEVEYVRASDAINFYDPEASGETNLEKSQVFMRNFRANDFETLTTVNIYLKSPREIAGRPAISYVIEKKPEVPDFPNQPSWRNGLHTVTDIRATDQTTSTFYVVAKNPDLAGSIYDEFLNSLTFPK
jgi:hypothetical protein